MAARLRVGARAIGVMTMGDSEPTAEPKAEAFSSKLDCIIRSDKSPFSKLVSG